MTSLKKSRYLDAERLIPVVDSLLGGLGQKYHATMAIGEDGARDDGEEYYL
jgi:hypothetical protein